jgi:II/X family phage/plasmid replication protein
MIDTLKLQLLIKEEFFVPCYNSKGELTGAEVLPTLLHQAGLKLAAGELEISDSGELSATRLYVPYQSLASSNSTLAFKLYTGGTNYFPFVELNASAAKLIQGHNVFGTDNLAICAAAMINVFYTHFDGIESFFDTHSIQVSQMDVTYTAHVKNDFIAKQVIQALSNVSTGQIKKSKSYATTAIFNAGSTHCMREVYLKEAETIRALDEMKTKSKKSGCPTHYSKQIKVLESAQVQTFLKGAVRFEAKIKKAWFKKRGIPTDLLGLIKYTSDQSIIKSMWGDAFNPILKTFEGQTMNIYNDAEVLDKLKQTYFTVNKDQKTYSKALRLFRFFRSLKAEGFENVKVTTPHNTFYRHMSDLTKVVPKAYIQNLLSSNNDNIIPLFKVINIDFDNQTPTGWIEPTFDNLELFA